jgi:hypothetical protein
VLYLPLVYASPRGARKPGSSAEQRIEPSAPIRLGFPKIEPAFEDAVLAADARPWPTKPRTTGTTSSPVTSCC